MGYLGAAKDGFPPASSVVEMEDEFRTFNRRVEVRNSVGMEA